MSPRQLKKLRREKRIAAFAEKVRQPGEFIHIGPRQSPRMASGQHVGKATLRDLVKRDVVGVVQIDLIGRPLQYMAKKHG